MVGVCHFSNVDECVINNGGCHQKCNNVPGGFNCTCMDGFAFIEEDEKSCTGMKKIRISTFCIMHVYLSYSMHITRNIPHA